VGHISLLIQGFRAFIAKIKQMMMDAGLFWWPRKVLIDGHVSGEAVVEFRKSLEQPQKV
jgi:hypothetical protein